jgi:anthranilate/para-aminobenzoate synthase component II
LFANVPSRLAVGRYHSLVVDEATLPPEMKITARSDDGTIMAIAHRKWPIFGVQFHPESILTEHGYQLLANFLRQAGIDYPDVAPPGENERPIATAPAAVPTGPVTF